MKTLIRFFKSISSKVVAVLLLFGITLFSVSVNAQLAGTYYIGPADSARADYNTLAEVADSLNSATCGISDSVIFEILPGEYETHITLYDILGTAADKQVVFRSETGDSLDVLLAHDHAHNSGINWMIRLDGTSYVTFRELSIDGSSTLYSSGYGRIILLQNGANNIKFQNNVFTGKPWTDYKSSRLIEGDNNHTVENILVEYNHLHGGTSAVRLEAGSSDRSDGNIIRHNMMTGQHDRVITAERQENLVIHDNFIDFNVDDRYGINLLDCDKELRITNNKIEQEDAVAVIYLNSCDGGTTTWGMVANNFIHIHHMGGNSNYGIQLNNSAKQKVYHNSVKISGGTDEGSACIYQGGGSSLDIRNNNLANFTRGYAYYIGGTGALSFSDNNNYYTNGDYIAYWGANRIDMDALLANSSKDDNSVSVHPNFHATSLSDLYTSTFMLYGKGILLADPEVEYDIDGLDKRVSPPCIGADEYFTTTGAAVSGTINIGASEAITTISELIDSMNRFGITGGPVTVNIRDDKAYDEKFTIGYIAGASAANRITFQSHPGNTGKATIQSAAASENANYVVMLRRASYVSLKNLKFSSGNATWPTAFRMESACLVDSILDCDFVAGATRDGYAVFHMAPGEIHDLTFKGNKISDGAIGLHLWGINDAPRYANNILVTENNLNNQKEEAIYFGRCNAPVVTNNYIESLSTWRGYGIRMVNCPQGITLTGNTIINRYEPYDYYYRGISLDNCDGSDGNESLIANNTVNYTGGSSDVYGIETVNSNYVNIYHNTVRIAGSNYDDDSDAYYNNGGLKIKVKNNIFANFGLGTAYFNNTGSAIDSSDNNLLVTSGKWIARLGSSKKTTFAAWKSSTGKDANSVEANPAFLSSEDLHAKSSFLDGAGGSVSEVPNDKDGVAWSSPRDIGAYKVNPSGPISGSFTVYGSSPNFPNLQSAMDSIQKKGMNGPVELIIRSGTHEVNLNTIRTIGGLTAKDSLLIRGETGDPEDVNLFTADNATIFPFRRARHITIRDLTINNTNPGGGKPIGFWSNTNNIRLINNRLLSANTANNSGQNAVLWIDDDGYNDSILIKDNQFSKGEYAIYFQGLSSSPATNTVITGNSSSSAGNMGFYLRYHTAPIVNNNTISNLASGDFEAMNIYNCHGELEVSGNRIDNAWTGNGIIINDCHATEFFRGLVSNNMIRIGGNYHARGIYMSSSEYVDLYHNSINISGTHKDYGFGLYLTNSNLGIKILNNIVANTGAGRALRNDANSAGDVLEHNYNSYFSKASDMFARWNGTECADLGALQAQNGMDANSLEKDPKFISPSELYSGQVALHQAATPLTEVTVDIDGITRDVSKPDIGASEFSCVQPDWNVWVSKTCKGDSTIIIDSSLNISAGSIRGWDFNGDGTPDKYSENKFDTITWLYTDEGNNNFTYRVTQIAGCNDFTNLSAQVIPPPILEITKKGAYCDTADGWAKVEVTNISGPFKYYWSDGQSDSTARNLNIGTYSVAVTDPNGCSTNKEVEIGEAIEVTVTQIKASTCGIPDGAAYVSAEGGFGPYDYVWSNGETSDTNVNLSPGTHYVNAIDSKGCYAQGLINLESDGGPKVTLNDITDNVCYGEQLGSIDISISQGVAPYTILWSNGAETEDIDSLAAGIYDVTVTAADGCMGAGSFQVFQPSQISISPVVTDATCNGADGSAVAVVSGGNKPYAYSWSSGGVFQIEEGLEAGVYSVTVTDGKGCKMIEPVLVNNVGAPVVYISDLQGVGCSVTNNGSISIDVTPAVGFYTYDWTTDGGGGLVAGEKNQSGLRAGSYQVLVTDAAGCIGVNQAIVKQEPPEMNPICLVTVDTATGMNMVIWEKTVTTDVSHYNVYRESSVKGSYQVVAKVGINEESLFVDSIADPTIRSWRYKLSVVDDCGNESDLSEHHKTMHLTMNVGLDESVNLIWDHYEGFTIPTYEIWRYDSAGGWTNPANMPSNLTSYTDASPPKEDLTYYIEVDHPTGCTSDDRKASTLNSSRSNRKNKLKEEETGTLDLLSITNFMVYPNPGSGMFNLKMDLDNYEDVFIKVYDVSGKLILSQEYLNVPYMLETQLDLTGYSNGIYQIHVSAGKTLVHRILVKQ